MALTLTFDETITGGAIRLFVPNLKRTVYVYRPGATAPGVLTDPATVSGDPEQPGFFSTWV